MWEPFFLSFWAFKHFCDVNYNFYFYFSNFSAKSAANPTGSELAHTLNCWPKRSVTPTRTNEYGTSRKEVDIACRTQPRSLGLPMVEAGHGPSQKEGGDKKTAGESNQVAILSFFNSLWKVKICLKI